MFPRSNLFCFAIFLSLLQLKEFFMRNKDVSDIRVVDMLVAKGQLELEETHAIWKQKSHVMRFFEDPAGPKQPKDFMTKFLAGSE